MQIPAIGFTPDHLFGEFAEEEIFCLSACLAKFSSAKKRL